MPDATSKSRLFLDIDHELKGAVFGLPFSKLALIEYSYHIKHQKPLDYKPFGVRTIQELFLQLAEQGKVLQLHDPITNEICYMSADLADCKQQFALKSMVKRSLKKHGGEITITQFESFFKAQRGADFYPQHFGLTSFDHLCRVLNDTVMLGVNHSGETVMKAVNKDSPRQVKKDYNLRKRKRNK